MIRIAMLCVTALILAGCNQEQSNGDKALIEAKLPKECILRDFGYYHYPSGGGTQVVAVICKNAVTSTSQSWKSGKSTYNSEIIFDTREE